MKVVLTVILLLSGNPPQVMQTEATSLEACFEAARSFVNDTSLIKSAGDQLAAGCAVVKESDDNDA